MGRGEEVMETAQRRTAVAANDAADGERLARRADFQTKAGRWWAGNLSKQKKMMEAHYPRAAIPF